MVLGLNIDVQFPWFIHLVIPQHSLIARFTLESMAMTLDVTFSVSNMKWAIC